jgi:pimeloyl-ACP methyl ester carboxylesterase
MDRDGTKRLLQKFPNMQYLTAKNSGHTLYMDNPAEFARCVRKALDSVDMAA